MGWVLASILAGYLAMSVVSCIVMLWVTKRSVSDMREPDTERCACGMTVPGPVELGGYLHEKLRCSPLREVIK